MSNRFELPAENPFAGRERKDVYPGDRGLPEGSQIIFHIVNDEFVDIICNPHKSMDIGSDFL